MLFHASAHKRSDAAARRSPDSNSPHQPRGASKARNWICCVRERDFNPPSRLEKAERPKISENINICDLLIMIRASVTMLTVSSRVEDAENG